MARGLMISCCLCVSLIVILFLILGFPLSYIFGAYDDKKPIFSVESTMVKAYNLTADNHLFCIINLVVRAKNPYPEKPTFVFNNVDMEVRKGKHHALANDALRYFSVGPLGEAVVVVEAVGLIVKLERKIAEEVRADVDAGEGRVNIFLSGYVGSDSLRVTCKNVVVDSSRSTKRVQMVGCRVEVILSGVV